LPLKAKVVTVISLLVWLTVCPLWAGTPGTFRGKIIEPPPGKEHQGWLYVQGRNKLLRRVAIENAAVVYADGVPSQQREKVPANALVEGAEVRVTAEQDESGEWRAQRIEILKAPTGRPSRATAI